MCTRVGYINLFVFDCETSNLILCNSRSYPFLGPISTKQIWYSSCSMKQRVPVMGLELTTGRFWVWRSIHCTTSPLTYVDRDWRTYMSAFPNMFNTRHMYVTGSTGLTIYRHSNTTLTRACPRYTRSIGFSIVAFNSSKQLNECRKCFLWIRLYPKYWGVRMSGFQNAIVYMIYFLMW